MEHCNDALHHGWDIEPTFGIEYVVFHFFGHTYMQYKCCTLMGLLSWVWKVDWLVVVEVVKKQCSSATQRLIEELDQRFPSQEIMNAIDIIYPQFWLQLEVKHDFLVQLNILKSHYCHMKHIGVNCVFNLPLLDEVLLDKQTYFFKITMMSNANVAMKPPTNCNLCSRMWALLANN